MTVDAKQLGASIAKIVGDILGPALSRLAGRVAALEAKTKELEARPSGLKYMGVFENGQTYIEDSLVTHSGSMWLALRTTSAKPGTHNAWRLVVKQGQG